MKYKLLLDTIYNITILVHCIIVTTYLYLIILNSTITSPPTCILLFSYLYLTILNSTIASTITHIYYSNYATKEETEDKNQIQGI